MNSCILVVWNASTTTIVRRSIAIGMIHIGMERMVGIRHIVLIGLHDGISIIHGAIHGILRGTMIVGDGTILIGDGVFLMYIIHIEADPILHVISLHQGLVAEQDTTIAPQHVLIATVLVSVQQYVIILVTIITANRTGNTIVVKMSNHRTAEIMDLEAIVEVLEMVLAEVVITAEASAVAVVVAALAADDNMLL